MWKKPNFIFANLCIYFYAVKYQSPSRCAPSDVIHLSGRFFQCSREPLNKDVEPVILSLRFGFGLTNFAIYACLAPVQWWIQNIGSVTSLDKREPVQTGSPTLERGRQCIFFFSLDKEKGSQLLDFNNIKVRSTARHLHSKYYDKLVNKNSAKKREQKKMLHRPFPKSSLPTSIAIIT